MSEARASARATHAQAPSLTVGLLKPAYPWNARIVHLSGSIKTRFFLEVIGSYFTVSGLDLRFSAPPLGPLRLSGECFQANIHRRDAEAAPDCAEKN